MLYFCMMLSCPKKSWTHVTSETCSLLPCLRRLHDGHTCTDKRKILEIANRVLKDDQFDKMPSALLRKGLRLAIDDCSLVVNEKNQMIQPYHSS